jgi:hypothetical protein
LWVLPEETRHPTFRALFAGTKLLQAVEFGTTVRAARRFPENGERSTFVDGTSHVLPVPGSELNLRSRESGKRVTLTAFRYGAGINEAPFHIRPIHNNRAAGFAVLFDRFRAG